MKCCICGKDIKGHGNNALPVKEGVCCDQCNYTKVIPAKMKYVKKSEKKSNS